VFFCLVVGKFEYQNKFDVNVCKQISSLYMIFTLAVTNLFSEHKSLSSLQAIINGELTSVNSWLWAFKISLNVKKSTLVVLKNNR